MGARYRIINLALRDSIKGSVTPNLARQLNICIVFLVFHKHWDSVFI
jgi:hypothetical protein